MQKVGKLRFLQFLADAKTGLNWLSFCSCDDPGKISSQVARGAKICVFLPYTDMNVMHTDV